jgi:hypothetical protein
MGRERIIGKVVDVQKKYMSLQETMKYLGVSEDTVRKLRNNCLIKSFKIDERTYLYDLASIDKFVESRNILRI